ncbi:plasma-membrane proton-efflux P-type ATPase [Desulfobacca acetoxidans]|uniref:Plasma-membrane proton-efflux P-type ATPase n=1 Tax=Desulfobacca acetoxidans (strain ATCC 700848 / DSM 11109 / ASRB2) TaxID=880072 RepID=F2NHC8_DESAR|nr:plasma-membrane proton-efflux P-type ATPase [Desulfobacca acetoxidans]AEB09044.1 plasma-membrane proton-efflux P-type ATPase [Desulfobacca acetoxidans DSM 11109]
MTVQQINTEKAQNLNIQDLFQLLGTSSQGLAEDEAQRRLDQFGPNSLVEKKINPALKFLSYFWGPIPWMIEIAAILSAVVQHWDDFTIIMLLLIFNASIGFWQEHKAANALEALKAQLALQARVRRDGRWKEIATASLVPGDIIRIRLGDIVPADIKLFEGEFLSVDQAALTGESLPVSKKPGDVAFSGSVAKQGEMAALVVSTGEDTFFGRTARLVQTAGAASHFQKAVLRIGDFLIYLSLGLVAVLVLVQLHRGASVLELVQFALILTVASIPVAMPAVLSVTMAMGALTLSKIQAIVSRLESIEEMAGIDILCSDKTGTLTQNKLTLGEAVVFAAKDDQELILWGALASKEEDRDPIDLAVIAGLPDAGILSRYHQQRFIPFDPVSKRTESLITDSRNQTFTVAKGAPQVIIGLCRLTPDESARAEKTVNELAARGYRTLGVARTQNGSVWEFLGILSLYDPPREDSAATVANAKTHGITIKMVTGDNVAIGREVSRQLGLGSNIQPADRLFRKGEVSEQLSTLAAAQIETADGYAQVFPEHKYGIVKALQTKGHIVGMTGDGVNDAPAIKQADVGIAVSGATDAARAAAALILTAPGLSVIINAVEEARKIFERMNSYAIFRITETIRIMFFVVLAMICYNFYPITAIMIILLAFFNDVPIMAIAFDNTRIDPQPVSWDMHRVLTVSTVLGLIGVGETFGLLIIAQNWLRLDVVQVQTFIFLKLAVAGHLTLFVARTPCFFLSRPFPAPALLWSAVVTKILATLFVVYPFGIIAPLTWSQVGLVWGYCLVWVFVEDVAKLMVYRHLDMVGPRHQRFLGLLKQRLTHYAHRS